METRKTIKVEGENLTKVKEVVAKHHAVIDKANELIDQLNTLVKDKQLTHRAMWELIESLYPETKEGRWRLDTEYKEQDIVVLSPRPAEDEDKSIAKLLGQLLGKAEEV